jgi:signal transduction histidine kinase
VKKLQDNSSSTGELLRSLFEATASATGDEFFNALASQLARTLGVHFAFVSELVEKGRTARTLAFWAGDRFVDNMEYALADTPCELVLKGEIVHIKEGLRRIYPTEEMLGIPLESYLGVPLVGRSGAVLGHVVAVDTKPMFDKPYDCSSLRAFAARATAELERRQTEQALNRAQAWLIQSERMAAVGQLTAGIAHEINTPIGVIRSSNDLLRRLVDKLDRAAGNGNGGRTEISGEIRECLEILKKSTALSSEATARIAAIIENLKKFTRLDKAARQNIRIQECIDSALGLLKPYLGNGVEVVRNYGDVPMIRSHPSELNQVFMTLLENACQAIVEEGTITITTYSDGQNIYAKVADTGTGIPEDQISGLFDVGFSTMGSRVGMRIGLSNALRIIENHGGYIGVKSSVGHGTEFAIELPIQ